MSGAVQAWRSPHFHRAAVLVFGGLIGCLCLGLAAYAATWAPWYAACLFLVPALIVVPLIFWLEASTADVREYLAMASPSPTHTARADGWRV